MKAVYIHIPFCTTICSYCDFCKMYYREDWVNSYLLSLEKEIKKKYRGEEIRSIYIGGGTPSCLSLFQLERLFSIVGILKTTFEIEFTFECNPDISYEKLDMLKKHGVNRLSIGVQTIHENHLSFLNRKHTKQQIEELIATAQNLGFDNINVDFMYAFPKETLLELKEDLKFFLQLGIPHISTYSLMIEPNTILGINHIQPIDEDLDYEMYHMIESVLEQNGFQHYETSNYSKQGYESKHNLVYWNNLEYYGFGLGASGYINNIRYENTRSLTIYNQGKYVLETHTLTPKETLENAFILGLRKLEGISIHEFKKRYFVNLQEIDVVNKLLNNGNLVRKGEFLCIPKDKIYISNTILLEFIDYNLE